MSSNQQNAAYQSGPVWASHNMPKDLEGTRRIDHLLVRLDTSQSAMHQLGCALLAALRNPQTADLLLSSDAAPALYDRLAQRYGHLPSPPTRAGRRLAPWQEHLAKKLLTADLSEELSVSVVADRCGLSPNRFAQAFRNSTGLSPSKWLRAARVGRAKDLLQESSLSLTQITYECGFADQAQFTKVFAAVVGVTPGAWRRSRRA